MESLPWFGCQHPGGWEVEGGLLSKERTPPLTTRGQELYGGEGRLPAKTARSALIVILKLVMGGLTSVTSIVYR